MAKKDQSVPGYEIKVTGEYYLKDPNTGMKSIKQFKAETFYLPEIVTYVEGREKLEKVIDGRSVTTTIPKRVKGNASRVGLHIIRRYYIESVLKEKYPGFTGVKTCEIFNKKKVGIDPHTISNLDGKPIQDMTEAELKQFVMLSDINLVLSQYGDLGDKKNAVERALQKKKQEDIAAGKTEAMTREEQNLLPVDGIKSDADEDPLGSLL